MFQSLISDFTGKDMYSARLLHLPFLPTLKDKWLLSRDDPVISRLCVYVCPVFMLCPISTYSQKSDHFQVIYLWLPCSDLNLRKVEVTNYKYMWISKLNVYLSRTSQIVTLCDWHLLEGVSSLAEKVNQGAPRVLQNWQKLTDRGVRNNVPNRGMDVQTGELVGQPRPASREWGGQRGGGLATQASGHRVFTNLARARGDTVQPRRPGHLVESATSTSCRRSQI